MPSDRTELDPRRVALAAELLQEAVYRSRGEQAGAALLRARRGDVEGNCGLGEKAAIVLDLTPRAEVVFDALFPAGLAAPQLGEAQRLLAAWVKRQDALDRRRNHFLKDFRQAHGFDRSTYDEATTATFEAGLARINGEAEEERQSAARALLAGVA